MRTLCILIIALVCIPFVSAKETFYSSLDSAKVVEEQDGVIDGGNQLKGSLNLFSTPAKFLLDFISI